MAASLVHWLQWKSIVRLAEVDDVHQRIQYIFWKSNPLCRKIKPIFARGAWRLETDKDVVADVEALHVTVVPSSNEMPGATFGNIQTST